MKDYDAMSSAAADPTRTVPVHGIQVLPSLTLTFNRSNFELG